MLGYSDHGLVQGAEMIFIARRSVRGRLDSDGGTEKASFMFYFHPRSSVSFETVRPVCTCLLVLLFYEKKCSSFTETTDCIASGRSRPIRVQTSRSTGGGECLLGRLERPQQASRLVVREAELSARHTSPARSLYATKSPPQVCSPRSSV